MSSPGHILDSLESRLSGPASAAALESVVDDLRALAAVQPPPTLDPQRLARVGALLQGWGEWGQGWQERIHDLQPPLTYDRAGNVNQAGPRGGVHG